MSAFEFLIERAMTGESCDGCLVVNTALELAPHDEEIARIVKEIFVGQEMLFRSYLERAMACGEVPQTLDPSRTAQTLLALSIALLVLVRSRPDEPLLRSIEHQVRTLLR